jgi:phosphate butyryltransferase
MIFSTLDDLFKQFKPAKKKLILAGAEDENALEAAFKAHQQGIIELICTGNKSKINRIAEECNLNLSGVEIIEANDKYQAVEKAVRYINEDKAQILMKGHISTSDLMKGVLNKEWGLRSGGLLSHFSIFEIKTYHKLLGITDVAMNIAPNLIEKIAIINNAVTYMDKIGFENLKVAIISAVETVNDAIPSSIDAAILSKMSDRGQISKCKIDGPFALDNAISSESAHHKGIKSDIAGDPDLLIMPDIVSGNVLYKALGFLTNSKLAAVIIGAKVPIVLTSRSDSEDAKFNSIYLAALGSGE